MACILMIIFGARLTGLVFVRTNYAFSKSGRGDAEAEHKLSDLVDEKRQEPKDKWNEDSKKRRGFINQKLRQKSEARTYIKNVDEAIPRVLSNIYKTNKTLTF